MSSMTSGWLLSDSSSQWKGVKSGRVFKALMDGEHANPVTVVDEIDKARADTQYDPLGVPCSLLEHDTALRFTDEFAKLANDERGIPAPILNRMNVFNVETPRWRPRARSPASRTKAFATTTTGARASGPIVRMMCWTSCACSPRAICAVC